MNTTDLKAVLREVVLDVCPSEQDLFEIEADTLIEEQTAGKKQMQSDTGDVQPKFGIPLNHDTLTTIDTYIKLIVTAIGALKSLGLFSAKPTVSEEQVGKLQAKWQHELERAGVPAPKSASIARRFSKDLVRVATKK